MNRNCTERQWTSSAAVILGCLVLGLGVLGGCFRADVRAPSNVNLSSILGTTDSSMSELGYGTLVTTDGRKILGWWRIDNNSKTYQRHEPPTTKSGRPTGFERTLEVIPDKRVVGFKRK